MLIDFYSQGILSLTALLLTALGGIIIVASAFILYKLKISLPLRLFSAVFIIIALFSIVIPPAWWLWVLVVFLCLFFTSGFVTAMLIRLSKINRVSAAYCHSPYMAFTGVDEMIRINFQSGRQVKKNRMALRFMSRFACFDIEGIDSPLMEVDFSGNKKMTLPVAINRNTLEKKIPVRFVLRGHDAGSHLYFMISFKYPLAFLIPWRRRVLCPMPEISVLSGTFAALAGKSLNVPRQQKLTRHPTERISRMRTDSFLHIAPYSAGESLSQIDFRATLRAGEIVSKKYSQTKELSCLVALGFGRRAQSSREGERLISELGKVLSENVSLDMASEVVFFDMIKRVQQRLGHGRESALNFGKQIVSVEPTHYEEDEFCVIENSGQSLNDYTHVRFILAWGGQFDLSRAISACSIFRRSGAACEIIVVASEVFKILNGQKDSETSLFFIRLMDRYTEEARKSGIVVRWLDELG